MLLLKTKKENEKLKKIYRNTTVWGFWCIFFQMFFLLNIYVYLYIYIFIFPHLQKGDNFKVLF